MIVKNSDASNEKEKNDPRGHAIFKQSRHSNKSIVKFSQDYYELPKQTVRANANIYQIFEPNNLRDVQNLHQNKTLLDITPIEFKVLTSSCWNERCQHLNIDM